MEEKQLSILDFGVNDAFDCSRCAFFKAHGYCYPGEDLNRQYYYEKDGQRFCSDYTTDFVALCDRYKVM